MINFWNLISNLITKYSILTFHFFISHFPKHSIIIYSIQVTLLYSLNHICKIFYFQPPSVQFTFLTNCRKYFSLLILSQFYTFYKHPSTSILPNFMVLQHSILGSHASKFCTFQKYLILNILNIISSSEIIHFNFTAFTKHYIMSSIQSYCLSVNFTL